MRHLVLALMVVAGLSAGGYAAEDTGKLWPSSLGKDALSDPDNTASKKNDLITIVVDEKNAAKSSSNLNTKRDDGIDIKLSDYFDPLRFFVALARSGSRRTDALADMSPFGSTDPTTAYDSKRDFKGEGEINTKNSVTSRITGRVIEVMPNGDLVFEARKSIEINGELTVVVVTGEIRKADVKPDNTVGSDRVADANIKFLGERGPITDATKRSWIRKFFDFVNIF